MSQYDHLLKRICGGETLEKARDLIQIAKSKTGPGSGYDLQENSTGLPGICAFLASQQLKNNEVTRANAQKAACMNKAVFDRCYNTVRSALGISERRGRSSAKEVTYKSLRDSYPFSKPYSAFQSWLHRVENALIMSGKNVNLESAHVKCAIFFWVYTAIEPKTIDMASYAAENRASLDRIRSLCTTLDDLCSTIRKGIIQESKRNPSPTKLTTTTPSTSPRKSPSKRPQRELPSRDTPKKRKVSPEPQHEKITTESITNDVEMASVENPVALPTKNTPTSSTTPLRTYLKRPRRELPSRDAKKTKLTLDTDRGEGSSHLTEEDELFVPQTPSKPQKHASSPLKGTTTLDFPASSSHINSDAFLDALGARRSETTSPTRRPKNTVSFPVPLISDTPRRSARNDPILSSPSKRSRAHAKEVLIDGDASSSSEVEDVLSAPQVRRRFRPVFLDRQQWFRLDSRVEELLKEAEKYKQRREQHGLPNHMHRLTGGSAMEVDA